MTGSLWSRRTVVRALGTALVSGGAAARTGAEATEEPHFYVKSIDPEMIELDVGESYDVTARILNIGTEGRRSIEYRIDDATLRSEQRTLDGAEEIDVTFETIDTGSMGPGSFTHGVYTGDASATGTVLVRGTSAFEVAGLSPRLGDAVPGGEFTVSVTVRNGGEASGTQTVRVTIDGEQRASESLTLERGETGDVDIPVPAPETEGEYSYTVETGDDQASGAVSVVAPSGDGGGGGGGIDAEVLLAAGGGALTLVGAYALLARHNTRRDGETVPESDPSDASSEPGPRHAVKGTLAGNAGAGDPSVVSGVIDDRLGEIQVAVDEAREHADRGRNVEAAAACERASDAAADAMETARRYAPDRIPEIESSLEEIERVENRIESREE